MPYISTPPATCSASKMVTLCPILAKSAAAVNPAGPEPTTATCLPVGLVGSIGESIASLLARSQSATYRSRRPIAIGACLFASEQAASHWVSWGQTRPQIPGRLFLLLSILTASGISPSTIALIKSGMSIPTGQPSMQGRLGHWIQRLASSLACSRV